MFGGRWSRTRCPIGIDVGTRSVRMLQLERSDAKKGVAGGGYAVVAAAEQDLPDELRGTGDQFHHAVGEVVRRLLAQGGFVGRRVVSCLPAPSVQYKNLRLPKMPADELPAAVQWEATDRLHLNREESSLRFFDAGEVRQGDEQREEIILLAAPASLVESHTKMLVGCGLEPEAIDVAPAALARSLNVLSPQAAVVSAEDAQARVLIDVGYQSSKVLILREERIVFFKLIGVGGRSFDQAVASALNLGLSDAAGLRRRCGEAAGEGEAAPKEVEKVQQVRSAMRPVVTDLAREIGLCLRYYSVTFRGRRPEAASLVGGEAGDAQLAQALSEGAGIHVEAADPLAGVDTSGASRVIRGGRDRLRWAVAAGLSLRGEPTPVARGAAKRPQGVAA